MWAVLLTGGTGVTWFVMEVAVFIQDTVVVLLLESVPTMNNYSFIIQDTPPFTLCELAYQLQLSLELQASMHFSRWDMMKESTKWPSHLYAWWQSRAGQLKVEIWMCLYINSWYNMSDWHDLSISHYSRRYYAILTLSLHWYNLGRWCHLGLLFGCSCQMPGRGTEPAPRTTSCIRLPCRRRSGSPRHLPVGWSRGNIPVKDNKK